MRLGLIGASLAHSFSPEYFKQKFLQEGLTDCSYNAYELSSLSGELLHEFILRERLNGFNVTIPYKEKIVPLLNELSPDAQQIGAVNTVDVKFISAGAYVLSGFNTDWRGFLKSIRPFLTLHHQQALIIGTGGASRAIAFALKSLGIDYFFVSRFKKSENILSYKQLNAYALNRFKLIINTTPLGTFPETNQAPDIPYEYLGTEHLLCDLVYNPAETLFMKKGKAAGANVMNGLAMLQFQADEGFEIWHKQKRAQQ